MSFDVFISYASEDKADVARPLAESLQRRGLTVWFDETSLKVGDSLSESIDQGLTQSRFAVVILSKHFFSKHWTKRELRGLVSQQSTQDRQMILPIWHGVNGHDVAEFSPPLADVIALSTEFGIESIAAEIMDTITGDSPLSSYAQMRSGDGGGDALPTNLSGNAPFILQRLYILANPYDGLHNDLRVGDYSAALAQCNQCTPEFVSRIRSAAVFRDIGKLAVPESIVFKAGKLTPAEYAVFQQHAAIGSEFLGQFSGLEMAACIARSHQEKWDGSGYPDALAQDAIPLESRIVCIADVYNALMQDRPYKTSFSHDRAMQILSEGSGNHFDPSLISLLSDNDRIFREILESED